MWHRNSTFSVGLALIFSVTALAWAEEPAVGESVNGLQALLAIQNPLVRPSEEVLLEVELRNVSQGSLLLVYSAILPGDRYGITSTKFMVRRAESAQSGFYDLRADDLIVDGVGVSSKQLDPGASLNTSLAMSLALADYDYTDGIQQFYLEPGRYEVSVLVSFWPSGKDTWAKDAWAGSVRSNWATFEVVKAE